MFGQHPEAVAQAPIAPSVEFVQQLQLLGWVDRTALAVLAVFFVIGLFKGLIWQVSRVAILVVAYAVSGRFGQPLGDLLARTPAVGGETATGPVQVDTPDTTLYLAYVLVFLAVLVVLSLAAILLQKLAKKAGLGFFDRLGGGVLGVATGACVVLFGLSVVHMFFQRSSLAQAAESSHSLRLSRRAIDWLGESVPDDLRLVFALTPLHAPPLPGQASEAPEGLSTDDPHGLQRLPATVTPSLPGTAPTQGPVPRTPPRRQ